MPTHDELTNRAAAAYNAAADSYDDPANTFWDRFGARTVERLALRPGMRVLDVCSGTGASAIPAAEAVGATGHVVAVDVADQLLARLRTKAAQRRLHHLETCTRDLLEIDDALSAFDAVICVFGIFFVADMAGALRLLWSRVAPGGAMAITTWGPRLFEPANAKFWEAVRAERPELYKQFNPWDSITTPDALQQLLSSAGVPAAEIVLERNHHPLPEPSAWWSLLMGSGYRGTLEQLSSATRERIKAHNSGYLETAKISQVEANVLYAVVRKDAVRSR